MRDNCHFVRITFEPVSGAEMEILLSQDERLNDLFTNPELVLYDGYERGADDFVMYFYGKDADSMASRIIPELRSLPFIDRGVVLKRHGDRGAREEILRLLNESKRWESGA